MTHGSRRSTKWRAGGSRKGALAITAALAALSPACGDGPICPLEIVVTITAPADGAEIGPNDDRSDEPGIQIDVTARSNLDEGETIELVVRDAAGGASSFNAALDGEGKATFRDVTIPSGDVRLEAHAVSSDCGAGTDTVTLSGRSDAACGLSIVEGPIQSEFYDPLPVLNTTNDSEPSLPDFQAHVDVDTVPGYAVELFVLDAEAGRETSEGEEIAATSGVARYHVTLGQGTQALRAHCHSRRGSTSAVSATQTVFVDTEPPSCELVHPPQGQAIIPELDEDPDESGTQITIVGRADDDDVDPESALFEVDAQALEGTPIEGGESTAVATFGAPGVFELGLSVADYAGNTCQVSRQVEYVTEGCAISHEAPTGVITHDVNPELPGVHAELAVDVDPACEGRTVTTTCDVTGEQSTQALADAPTTLEIAVCEDSECVTTYDCETRVSSAAGIETFAPATIEVDTQPPPVALEFVDPDDLSCDDVVDDSVDVDENSGGVHIDARALSPTAASRHIMVTSDDGSIVYGGDETGEARIELFEGGNDIVALASDEHGNEAQTDPCTITLEDLVVTFGPPVSSQILGRNDGEVIGDELELDVCGTVSAEDAAVEVAIDGGEPQPASVSGDAWCLEDARLAEGGRMLFASAQRGEDTGARSISVQVDLTPPDAPEDLATLSPHRAAAELEWTAPADDSGSRVDEYIVVLDTEPLSEDTFEEGTVVDGPVPGSPGTTESVVVEELFAGTAYYVAVAAVDAAGNRSAIAATPADQPLVPDFARSGAVGPFDPDESGVAQLGRSMTRGDLSGNALEDLVLGAPLEDNDREDASSDFFGNVYVYLGREQGVSATPDYVLRGSSQSGFFGHAVAALDWNGDGVDDLVVGAPLQDVDNGRLFVFFGGDRFADAGADGPLEIGQSEADVVIDVDHDDAFYGFSNTGFTLGVADFDGDGRDDLVIGSVEADGGAGGATILFGGSQPAGDLTLSRSPDVANVTGYVLPNPNPDDGRLGTFIHNLGATREGSHRDDVAVGGDSGGSLYVWRGRSDQPDGGLVTLPLSRSVDLEITDSENARLFGEAMSSIPALGTGRARDIVIASVGEDGSDPETSGVVRILDGGITGKRALTSGGLLVATIEAESGVERFGADVATNGESTQPDINGDGREDLVIAGGRGDDFGLHIWYGGIAGDTTSASADHVIPAPAGFVNGPTSEGQRTRIGVAWAGDVTGNGLEDLVWIDHRQGDGAGAFELLFDEPQR